MSDTADAVSSDEDGYEAALLEAARIDWVVFGSWARLHNPVAMTANDIDWCMQDVVTACGLIRERAYIPGIFTRMGAPRCSHCCDRSGFPRGQGSPKNDDACRALLGLTSGSGAPCEPPVPVTTIA